MSAQAESRGTDHAELIEQHPTVVVGGCRSVLHLPGEDGKPLCPTVLPASSPSSWRTKSAAVFPAGHRDWCERCLEIGQDGEEQDTDEGSQMHYEESSEYGNALEADWG